MFTKLLLTLLVILAAWRVVQYRRKLPPIYRPPETIEPRSATPNTRTNNSRRRRWIAWGMVALLFIATGWLLYSHWYDAQRLVEVRVTNANTGESMHYSARKGQVDPQAGSFTTLSGNRVILADVERMEILVR